MREATRSLVLLPVWEKAWPKAANEEFLPDRNTPRPTLLRSATLSHKGRRKVVTPHACPLFVGKGGVGVALLPANAEME